MSMKILVLLTFFTQVNEKNGNLSWKAIDYTGPPHPTWKSNRSSMKTTEDDNHMSPEQEQEQRHKRDEDPIVLGPLHRGIIDPTREPTEQVLHRLLKMEFPISLNPKKKKPQDPTFVVECDAVVVGSGSGGGVIAGVLANAGHKVLVLEKGKYFARSGLSLLEGPTLDQMYLGNGLLATTDMDVLVLAGATVGGGSTINWSASIETPPHVLKEWKEVHKLQIFESEAYKQAMVTVSSKMGVQSEEVQDEGFHNTVLRKGCEELGYPVETIPRNTPQDHYCGWCGFGCKDGKKKGTAETWLVDMVDSGNGVILPGCEALRVSHHKNNGKKKKKRRADGVVFAFRKRNGVKEIWMVKSKVTVVAGGAICTPSLLKNSGLKNRNIGRNLHLHPVVFAWGYFPDTPPSSSSSPETWPEAQKKGYQGGIMTAMSKVVANFEESGYGAIIQTPSLHPGIFSAVMPWTSGADIKTRMRRFSRTAVLFALARDRTTSGKVDSPSSITYKIEETEKETLRNGLDRLLRILEAAGAEEIGTCNREGKTLKVNRAAGGREEFEAFVAAESSRDLGDLSTLIGSAHQMGSCRMGVDPRSSAVDPTGESWEAEGLFVADSSVFPTALGVNPMLTVQAIAYCTANHVLQALGTR